MTTRATLRQQGEALRQRLFGDDDGAPAVMRTLNVEASYGAIWSRPVDAAAAPLESGVPIVRLDSRDASLSEHDGYDSGGLCTRSADAGSQRLYAGTSDSHCGEAALGRG